MINKDADCTCTGWSAPLLFTNPEDGRHTHSNVLVDSFLFSLRKNVGDVPTSSLKQCMVGP